MPTKIELALEQSQQGVSDDVLVQIYQKNHKKTVKNGQAQTRESEEYKKKPKNQSRSQKSQTRTAPSSVPALWPWFVQSASAVLSYEGNADLL
ncbi:hypothetical protein Tco_1212836 [Tanacetum coccineum]